MRNLKLREGRELTFIRSLLCALKPSCSLLCKSLYPTAALPSGVTSLAVGFPSSSGVKNLPAVQEMRVRSLCEEIALEEDMAAHSSILA